MTSTIVVGYVPTPQGEAALRRAIDEAKAHSAQLVVVNSSKRDAYVDAALVDKGHWKTLEARLETAAIPYLMVQPESGHDPSDLILKCCEEYDADLVVIGLRKRSQVGKMLLGSTAQRILMHARCDILSVRANF
jgi:nucleotide-binding universal stress UspA family protein